MPSKVKKIAPISQSEQQHQEIDGLLSGIVWNLSVFPNGITYSYPDRASDYGRFYWDGEPQAHFKALNSTMRSAVDFAINQFGAVSGLVFQKISFGGQSDGSAEIRFGMSNKPSTAWAYYPSDAPEGGDVWYNNSKKYYDNPHMGNYAWFTTLHETGHTLGLKHAHEPLVRYGIVDPSKDSMEYTVMSYRSYVGDEGGGYSNETWGYAQTPMMYDIAALQYMYGPDWMTRSGSTTYTWSPTTGQLSTQENGVSTPLPKPGGGSTDASANRIFMTIWDGGGEDTLDFRAYTKNLDINLQPGEWTKTDRDTNYQTARLNSYEGGTKLAEGNIANALTYKTYNADGTVATESLASLIENAIGGSGNDWFGGNAGTNSFTGGGGADRMEYAGPRTGIDYFMDYNYGQHDEIDTNGLSHTETLATGGVKIAFSNADGSAAGSIILVDHTALKDIYFV